MVMFMNFVSTEVTISLSVLEEHVAFYLSLELLYLLNLLSIPDLLSLPDLRSTSTLMLTCLLSVLDLLSSSYLLSSTILMVPPFYIKDNHSQLHL